MASTAKRLGEDKFFSGAFVVFRSISAIFRAFCLVVLRNFVYLQAVKDVTPLAILSINELKINMQRIETKPIKSCFRGRINVVLSDMDTKLSR